ncbi:hypothetical protein Syn8016DRAFT_1133 [Synechococcus sp. WH 8016]|nr:hypothetical protein Syn8016DRAFT_1133 [Synechococcus sp. WH 8016]
MHASHSNHMKATTLGLAAVLAATTTDIGIAKAQFSPRKPVEEINNSLHTTKTGTLTIKNPLRFTIQQKKGSQWETIGRGATITKTARLRPGATANFEFRIIDRNSPSKAIFNHSAGPLHSEMYRRASFKASLGHQGFEPTFQICIPGDRCRSGGALRSISRESAELTIRPNPATTSVKLGQGMAFKGNTSTPAAELLICSRRPPAVTYIPYFGGRIGRVNANGTSSNYLASGASDSALSQWCSRTFQGRSGFITKNLKLSDMIALTAGGASSYFSNSALSSMPGAPGAPGKNYWSLGRTYKTFIYDSNNKSVSLISSFNTSVREKLQDTFKSPGKSLYVVRNIYPSNRNQFIEIVNLTNAIAGINNIRGSVRANSRGSRWTVTVAGETMTVDVGKTTRDIDGDYKGLTIDNRPSMNISNARLTSSQNNQFEINFRVNVSKVTGEIYNDGGIDYDYEIKRGKIDMKIPFAIVKEGNAIKVNQLKNCARGECSTNISGFGFDLTGTPNFILRAFNVNKSKITGNVQETISKGIGKSLQTSLRPISARKFPMPTIGAIPGINANPLEYFLGINPDIVPNIHVNATAKTISLKYQPKVPFVTPAFMRSQIPLINISYP